MTACDVIDDATDSAVTADIVVAAVPEDDAVASDVAVGDCAAAGKLLSQLEDAVSS